MNADKINALSTAIIAFATILGLITALYYYLESFQTKTLYIWMFEILIVISIVAFIILIERGMEDENK